MTKINQTNTVSITRPPIVAILGHVDHGKTTLLDTIRNTNFATKEHGGITQSIGAYQVEFQQKKITFIDTPGHEAFIKMRARGVSVADIAILVVAGNDGVKPQTIESFKHITSAKIPFIVALNKIDLPNINSEKVKKQLTKIGIKLEEYGGETPLIPISAKNNQGIDKLLEMILLLSELYQVKEKNSDLLQAVIIESSLSKTKGPIASIILKKGTLSKGEEVICDNQTFRVRALFDWKGKNLIKIAAGDPAEVIGWKYPPEIGSLLYAKNQIKFLSSSTISENKRKNYKPLNTTAISTGKSSNENKIKIIIKADTAGSLEAIINGLKDQVDIVFMGVGNITESDILLAKTTKSIVIGFNSKLSENVSRLATAEKIIIKTYSIIYELFNEINEVVEAVKQRGELNILGEAKIIALFPIKDNVVAGAKVISGRIARGDKVVIQSGKKEIAQTKIKSLRHGKKDITKAEKGNEVGILFTQKIDLLTDYSIISIG